jgi:hypothetical protein
MQVRKRSPRTRAASRNNIMDQLAVNTRCSSVSAYIEGYDKFDGKFNAAAMQAEEGSGYWSLMVDYAPGSKVHGWSLFPVNASGTTPSDGRLISGEGTVSQIAEQVCIVSQDMVRVFADPSSFRSMAAELLCN